MGRWSHRTLEPADAASRTATTRTACSSGSGIGGLGDRQIRELSGGQQQRVFLARALIGDPLLLLLDEPTSGVDLKTRDEVLHLLADLNAQGTTIVMTTHELNAVAAHLPWVVCVNRTIIAAGRPRPGLHAARSSTARTRPTCASSARTARSSSRTPRRIGCARRSATARRLRARPPRARRASDHVHLERRAGADDPR